MSGKHVYWFAGDRFSCVNRKKQTLNTLFEDGNEWAVHDVTKMKPNKIYSLINSCPLFGATHIAFVCDGALPEAKRAVEILLRLPDDRAFILLDPKIDKRSITYKKLKDKMEFFDSAVSKEGYVDSDKIELVGEDVKKMSAWEGDDDIFDYIFESCGYDIGRAVSEIEKIRVYINKKEINDINKVEEILCKSNIPDIDDLIRSMLQSDVGKSFDILNKIMNSVEVDNYAFKFFTGMIDRLMIIAYACLAFETGAKSNKEASKTVANRMEVGNKKINQYYILNRVNNYEGIIVSSDSERALKIVDYARMGIDDLSYGRGKPAFLMKRFVYNSL